MKTSLFIILGMLVGAILVYAWQGYQHQQNRLSNYQEGSERTVYSDEKQSFYISYQSLLLVKDLSNGEDFRVSFTPGKNGVISYRWTSPLNTANEGEGKLFEDYDITSVDFEIPSVRVKDGDNSLFMHVGNISLEWSASAIDGGWIYYNPRSVALSVQSNQQ